mgnify:FL=1|jgi:hypothetical protein
MSVQQENRYRKLVISQGRMATDRQREVEAACMVRGPRKPVIPPPPSARRRDVRLWMRHNAEHYETATELAEAANAVFRLPDGGLDDETHWVWDEACEAMGDA